MKLAPSPQIQSVQEWDDEFLALWPYRYDYLWAPHPNPNERPDWQTESRYPLGDRQIKQGAFLYGVRFGATTRYFVIDIDRGSPYHPIRDRFAWRRMVAALESLGVVQVVACTSSYSGGLHLYVPLEQEQKTWAIALAVSTLLENAGFKLAPGQLEVFPNCKPYSTSGEYSLYNGHRLPMQAGSYLLNHEMQRIWSDQQTFVQHWRFAQRKNSVDSKSIERIIKAARRKQYRITGKADKFLNDLNTEIELGWTGSGQTNRLIGRITMRSYIFGHVLYAGAPLEGNALIEDVINIAQSLPGYSEWCQHQHEIEKRVKEWASSIEQSHYFHYGSPKPQSSLSSTPAIHTDLTWNQQTQLDARERIRQATADLLNQDKLPVGITARFNALVTYGISGSTLYRHRDLWHPQHIQEQPGGALQCELGEGCQNGAPSPDTHPNLLDTNGCNSSPGEHRSNSNQEIQPEAGCNSLMGQGLNPSTPQIMSQEEGIAYLKQVLATIRQRQLAEKLERDGGISSSDNTSEQ